MIYRLPRDVLIEDEREVPAHGLEAGDVARDRLAKRELVEAIEIEFAEEHGVLEFAGRWLRVG